MNSTQTQTTLTPIIAFLAGILAGKGVFGLDSETWIAILGGVGGVIAAIWSAVVTRKSNLIGTVNAMSEVAGVVTTPDEAGKAMARAVPSATVVSAGTGAALEVAKNTVTK